MTKTGPHRTTELVIRSSSALGLSQKQLAELCGVSHSTAHRWEGGRSSPTTSQLHRLANEVYRVDPALAGEIAVHTGTTLETIVPEAAVAAVTLAANAATAAKANGGAPVPAAPRPRPFPPVGLLLDSILVVAGDAGEQQGVAGVSRGALRAIVAAAFGRAKGLGLTVEEVEGAMGRWGGARGGETRQGARPRAIRAASPSAAPTHLIGLAVDDKLFNARETSSESSALGAREHLLAGIIGSGKSEEVAAYELCVRPSTASVS
jgi:DNA-binding XRE family transcriptional regulator